jgi:hypothetical protein
MLRIWKSRIVAVAPILFLLPARFAAGEVLVHIALPEANAAYSAGEVIPIEVEFLTSEEPVAGMDLHIKCESDALLIQNVTFDQAFSLALLPTSTTLPSKFFRDVRVRDAGREPADSGLASGTRLALIELEVLDDQPFSAPVQIEAKLATVGRKQAPTVIRYDGPHEKIPNGIRILIENSPATAVAPESPPGPGEAVAMGGESSMTLGGLEGGAVATASAPAANGALALEVQPSGGGDPVTTLTADEEYELHYDSDGVLPNSFAAKNWLP